MLRMGSTGKKPDYLDLLIGNNKAHFFNLGCCDPKPAPFLSRISHL